jgi:hypothetical protein
LLVLRPISGEVIDLHEKVEVGKEDRNRNSRKVKSGWKSSRIERKRKRHQTGLKFLGFRLFNGKIAKRKLQRYGYVILR